MTLAPTTWVNPSYPERVELVPEIREFERQARDLPQIEMPVKHWFTPGLYAREIFMPKGTLLTSKIHMTEHLYTISKGAARVWTKFEGVLELVAPFTGITKPGTQRILYILEDCIWTTFHPTLETDLAIIEAQTIFSQPTDEEVACLGQQ